MTFASRPHARGRIWDAFRRYYGEAGDPLILVAHGATGTLNPSLPQRVVDRASRRIAPTQRRSTSPSSAPMSELVALEIIEGRVGDTARAAGSGGQYRAFGTPRAARDDITFAIAHRSARPDERITMDAVREMRPQFSPEGVVTNSGGCSRATA